MSSETTAELADLVHEWLRIDRVRVDNVLQYDLSTLNRARQESWHKAGDFGSMGCRTH